MRCSRWLIGESIGYEIEFWRRTRGSTSEERHVGAQATPRLERHDPRRELDLPRTAKVIRSAGRQSPGGIFALDNWQRCIYPMHRNTMY